MKEIKTINFCENSRRYLYLKEQNKYLLCDIKKHKSPNTIRMKQASDDFEFYKNMIEKEPILQINESSKFSKLINVTFKIIKEQYNSLGKLDYYEKSVNRRKIFLTDYFYKFDCLVSDIKEKQIIEYLTWMNDLNYCPTNLGTQLNFIVRCFQLYNNICENKNMIFENKSSTNFLNIIYKEKNLLLREKKNKNIKEEITKENNINIKIKKIGKHFKYLSKGNFFVFVDDFNTLYIKVSEKTVNGKTYNACNILNGNLHCVDSYCSVVEMKINIDAEELI